MEKKIINGDIYNLVDSLIEYSACFDCVFIDSNCNCTLKEHTSGLNKQDEIDLFNMCMNNPKMHWKKENKEAEIHNLTIGTISTMNIGDTIILGRYPYKLDECLPHPDNETKCNQCVFGIEGRCCLRNDDNALKDRADELIANCERESTAIYKVVKPIKSKIIVKDNPDDISSTGVVNPSTDAALKEPSNDTPRIINKNVKRHIDVALTLDSARNWYNSHIPILKDLACRAFTPAEIEDVRRCTMDIDIKTAKRLYRNAENAVRDFVLSAFSEEELKD